MHSPTRKSTTSTTADYTSKPLRSQTYVPHAGPDLTPSSWKAKLVYSAALPTGLPPINSGQEHRHGRHGAALCKYGIAQTAYSTDLLDHGYYLANVCDGPGLSTKTYDTHSFTFEQQKVSYSTKTTLTADTCRAFGLPGSPATNRSQYMRTPFY